MWSHALPLSQRKRERLILNHTNLMDFHSQWLLSTWFLWLNFLNTKKWILWSWEAQQRVKKESIAKLITLRNWQISFKKWLSNSTSQGQSFPKECTRRLKAKMIDCPQHSLEAQLPSTCSMDLSILEQWKKHYREKTLYLLAIILDLALDMTNCWYLGHLTFCFWLTLDTRLFLRKPLTSLTWKVNSVCLRGCSKRASNSSWSLLKIHLEQWQPTQKIQKQRTNKSRKVHGVVLITVCMEFKAGKMKIQNDMWVATNWFSLWMSGKVKTW